MTSDVANVVMFLVAAMSAAIAAYSVTQTEQALDLAGTSNLQERQIDACAEVIGNFAVYMSAARLDELVSSFKGTRPKLELNGEGKDGINWSESSFDAKVAKHDDLLASLARLEVFSGDEMVSQLNKFRQQFWVSFKPIGQDKEPDLNSVEAGFEPIKKACVSVMQGQKRGLL